MGRDLTARRPGTRGNPQARTADPRYPRGHPADFRIVRIPVPQSTPPHHIRPRRAAGLVRQAASM